MYLTVMLVELSDGAIHILSKKYYTKKSKNRIVVSTITLLLLNGNNSHTYTYTYSIHYYAYVDITVRKHQNWWVM